MPYDESTPPVMGSQSQPEIPEMAAQPGGTVVAPSESVTPAPLDVEPITPPADGTFHMPEDVPAPTPPESQAPAAEAPHAPESPMAIPVTQVEEAPQPVEVSQVAAPHEAEPDLDMGSESHGQEHSEQPEVEPHTEAVAPVEAELASAEPEPAASEAPGLSLVPELPAEEEVAEQESENEQSKEQRIEDIKSHLAFIKKELQVLGAEFDLISKKGPSSAQEIADLIEVVDAIQNHLKESALLHKNLADLGTTLEAEAA